MELPSAARECDLPLDACAALHLTAPLKTTAAGDGRPGDIFVYCKIAGTTQGLTGSLLWLGDFSTFPPGAPSSNSP